MNAGTSLLLVLLAGAIAAAGLIGYDVGHDDPPPACTSTTIADECTVPADRGVPDDLPAWAADELIDLRAKVAKLRALRSIERAPALPHYVVPDTGERGPS